ncbi:MAG: rod shape-determining protein MreC [Gammaproteobacteria bacterium]|nr:rod shape-determining protein MreC [Gammaproteobacteria bacterium]
MAFSTPDSDQRAFREPSLGPRTAIICILSVGLMTLDNQNDHMQTARSVLATIAYPIRVLIDAPSSFGQWLSESVSTRGTLLSENRELNQRILVQDARLQRMAALEAENARLRALLDSTAKVGDRVLVAEIMSVDMNPFRHKIVVNKGSSDDVYVGQALIDAQGVIGQVTREQLYSAEALLITDVDHALPVELLRNQLRTIAVGTGDLEKLSLPFLPRNADVIEGDLLVTSGLGGTFPPGYPVGVIKEVAGESGQPFLAITATPAAALNRIREVLLIWPDPTGTVAIATEAEAEAEAEELEAEPGAAANAEEPAIEQPDPDASADAATEDPVTDDAAPPAIDASDEPGTEAPD